MQYANPPLPSGIYSGGNVKFDSRQAAAYLHQDQLRRQDNQLRSARDVDNMLKGEMGKVRSADVPLVMEAYDKFKKNTQAVLFDKKLQRDPVAYANAQRDAAKAHQDFMQIATGSQQAKAAMEGRHKLYLEKPDLFSDDYGKLESTFNSTPLNQLSGVDYNGQKLDLTNDDSFRYTGTNTDLGKLVKDAGGAPRDIYGAPIPMDKAGLQMEIPSYKFGASPDQVKGTLLNNAASRGIGRDFGRLVDDPNFQHNYEQVEQLYKAIPKEKITQMGIKDLPDLTPQNPQNKSDLASSYLAMKYAVENNPTKGESKFRTNEATKMNMEEGKDVRMEGLRNKHEQANILLRKKLGDDGAKEVDDSGGMDQYMDDLFARAKSNPREYKTAAGQVSTQYLIPASAASKKIFEAQVDQKDANGIIKQVPRQPDDLHFSADGKYVTPIFYNHDRDEKGNDLGTTTLVKGKASIDSHLSQPVPVEEVKARWGKELLGIRKSSKSVGKSRPVDAGFKLTKGSLD
jgi:hypothetical protein